MYKNVYNIGPLDKLLYAFQKEMLVVHKPSRQQATTLSQHSSCLTQTSSHCWYYLALFSLRGETALTLHYSVTFIHIAAGLHGAACVKMA